MVGLIAAFVLLALWIAMQVIALTVVHLNTLIDGLRSLWLVYFITFLHMGLFITVHDACHGTVAPGRPQINLWVGRIFSFLYASFSFKKLQEKHRQHHQFAETQKDPDYFLEGKDSVARWALRFMGQYISIGQILMMTFIAQILIHGLSLPEANVFLFWVAPSVLSSFQLFYFGTYLPHRLPGINFDYRDQAQNISVPWILSLISCYHFGVYHRLHHRSPSIPWYNLPRRNE